MVGGGWPIPRHVIIRVMPNVNVVLPGARTTWAGSTLKEEKLKEVHCSYHRKS